MTELSPASITRRVPKRTHPDARETKSETPNGIDLADELGVVPQPQRVAVDHQKQADVTIEETDPGEVVGSERGCRVLLATWSR